MARRETGLGIDPTESRAATAPFEVAIVIPSEPQVGFTLTQPAPFPGGKVQRDGVVVARWTDGDGEHTAAMGHTVVFV